MYRANRRKFNVTIVKTKAKQSYIMSLLEQLGYCDGKLIRRVESTKKNKNQTRSLYTPQNIQCKNRKIYLSHKEHYFVLLLVSFFLL
jgi:hypothetical protein